MSVNSEKQTVYCAKCGVLSEYSNDSLIVSCPKCGVTVGNPYNGRMECCVCGIHEQAHPDRRSQWRALDVAIGPKRRVTFYACPKEFPPDGAKTKEFEKAYRKVLAVVEAKLGGKFA